MDIPINETGREQAAGNGRALTKLIDDPDKWRFIASPLGRTRETMDIIRKQFGLDAHGYETDDRLKEITDGLWEGYTHAELQAAHTKDVDLRDADKWNFRPPNGESWNEVRARVNAVIDRLIGDHTGQDLIIVAHFGVILTQVQRALNISSYDTFSHKIENLSLTRIEVTGSEWSARSINQKL